MQLLRPGRYARIALPVIAVLLASHSAHAGSEITSRAALEALLGPSAVTERFERLGVPASTSVDIGNGPYDAASVIDGDGPALFLPGLTFKQTSGGGSLRWVGPSGGYSSRLRGVDGHNLRAPRIHIDFAEPVAAFGMDLHPGTLHGFDVTVYEGDNATILHSREWPSGAPEPFFFGYDGEGVPIGKIMVTYGCPCPGRYTPMIDDFTYPLVEPPVLYGVSGEPSDLFSIDRATGAGMLIGPLGVTFAGDGDVGLAYDSSRDQLVALPGTSGTPDVISIDPMTGAGQSSGSVGSPISDPGLAFDPAIGRIYVANEIDPDDLLLLHPTTTQLTNIGPLGVDLDNPGLAYDHGGGVLYAVSGTDLYSVDPSTGVATVLATDLLPAGARLAGLTFDPLTGLLYASEIDLDAPDSGLYAISTIPPFAASFVGLLGFDNVQGLAARTAGTPSVPSLDWRGAGMLVLALSLVVSFLQRGRSRRDEHPSRT